MDHARALRSWPRLSRWRAQVPRRRAVLLAQVLPAFAAVCAVLPAAAPAAPVTAGFRDFSYGALVSAPTGQKPESKLWFNDGRWWAVMFNVSSQRFEIHGFNKDTQDGNAWTSTGTAVDVRRMATTDAKWTGAKLFLVSHLAERVVTTDNSVSVRRYGYTPGALPGTGTYTLETSKDIASGALEAVVLDSDSRGRLWATWTADNGSGGRAVYATHTVDGDTDFVPPYVLPVADAGNLSADDISTLVASGGKIGILWSNQTTAKLWFATHEDGNADDRAWTARTLCSMTKCPDDHLDIRSLEGGPGGQVFAIVKTSLNDVASPGTAPLIVLYRIDVRTLMAEGHTVWTVADDVTRAIVQLDKQNGEVYAFAAGPCCNGGVVYMKKSKSANPAFAPGLGTPFIQSGSDTNVNNPTSTKQSLDSTTGLLVLAGDDQTRYYLHNYLSLRVGSGGGRTPAYPAPERERSLSIAAKPTITLYGRRTVISGRLRDGSVAGKTVVLRADEYPFTGDAVVATARTRTDGSYRFERRPRRNTLFRTTVGALGSPVARVGVRIRLSLAVSDPTPRVGQRVRFEGRACPAHDGLLLRIQRRARRGRYRTVRRARLSAAVGCSRYKRTFRIHRNGRYRATADDADHARGFSRSRLIDVR